MLSGMTRSLSGALATSALLMFAVMLLTMSWAQSIAAPESAAPALLTMLVWGAGLFIGGALLRGGHRVWGFAWLLGTGGSVAAFVAGLVGLMLGTSA